jgi:hypothetical protein
LTERKQRPLVDVPEEINRHLMLGAGEYTVGCWHCLLSHLSTFSPLGPGIARTLLRKYVAITKDHATGGPDLWAGCIVATNRHLMFVEDGIMNRGRAQMESIPLEQITHVEGTRMLAIASRTYRWTWYATDLKNFNGKTGSWAPLSAVDVAEHLQMSVDARYREIEDEKSRRRARIDSFSSRKRP